VVFSSEMRMANRIVVRLHTVLAGLS